MSRAALGERSRLGRGGGWGEEEVEEVVERMDDDGASECVLRLRDLELKSRLASCIFICMWCCVLESCRETRHVGTCESYGGLRKNEK